MPRIELETIIKADRKIVFDLSRSIDLHMKSTESTHETAISGKTKGLIGLNETVTWKAKHLGVYQKLTSKITEYEYPKYFVDEMLKGIFKRFRHEHYFKNIAEGTIMIDVFDYEAPLGLLGKTADRIFLKNYMKNFLLKRNLVIKDFAETEKWKELLI
ncbi:SRPBCC family protein [Aquimarina rhabdastrellae]